MGPVHRSIHVVGNHSTMASNLLFRILSRELLNIPLPSLFIPVGYATIAIVTTLVCTAKFTADVVFRPNPPTITQPETYDFIIGLKYFSCRSWMHYNNVSHKIHIWIAQSQLEEVRLVLWLRTGLAKMPDGKVHNK